MDGERSGGPAEVAYLNVALAVIDPAIAPGQIDAAKMISQGLANRNFDVGVPLLDLLRRRADRFGHQYGHRDFIGPSRGVEQVNRAVIRKAVGLQPEDSLVYPLDLHCQ